MMDRLLELSPCALVPTGRTGSDFFQSMFDSHPEVLTFNGHLLFYRFWQESICVAAGDFDPSDLIEEFIGRHIKLFKSRYDIFERKHRLGDEQDESIDIDLNMFRSTTARLLEGREVNSRNFLLAIYGAYSICLGEDLSRKKLFFHHPHRFGELDAYLEDFPDSKVICMTRDPRANFVSGVEHHRLYNYTSDHDNGPHVLFTITRILNDATPLEDSGNEYRVIRVEDLGRIEILRACCDWLNISYDQILTKSTWGGLSWHGDNLSKVNQETGFSSKMLENNWEKRLSSTDKYVLNYIMNPRLKQYGYNHGKAGILGAIVVALLIFLPLSCELRFMSPSYILIRLRTGQHLMLVRNWISYVRRIKVFFKFYFNVIGRKPFNQPLLAIDPDPTIVTHPLNTPQR